MTSLDTRSVVLVDGARESAYRSHIYSPSDQPFAASAGVFSYVARASRGQGVGREATEALIAAAEAAGFWKLVSGVFPENTASRRLLHSTGFREVGLYRRHARLEGTWRDVVIVERLLGQAGEERGRV